MNEWMKAKSSSSSSELPKCKDIKNIRKEPDPKKNLKECL
mgnify:CR=1 FL=1